MNNIIMLPPVLPHGVTTKKLIKDFLDLSKKYNIAEQKLAAKYESKLDKLKEEIIASKCPHPVEARETYSWTWDDGYGSMNTKTGVRCSICLEQCSYPGYSNWFKPSSREDD